MIVCDNTNISVIGARQNVWIEGEEYDAVYLGGGSLVIESGEKVSVERCSKRNHVGDEPGFFPPFNLTLVEMTVAYAEQDGLLVEAFDLRPGEVIRFYKIVKLRLGHSPVVAGQFMHSGLTLYIDLGQVRFTQDEPVPSPRPFLSLVSSR